MKLLRFHAKFTKKTKVKILIEPDVTSCPLCESSGEMKIHVQFYAHLRDLSGVQEIDVDIPSGSTVRDLLEKIYSQTPSLRSHDKSILIGAGVEFADRNDKLKPGEEIAIMPPVQGG